MNQLCVILGAGEIADYPAVREQLEPGAFILCADGGFLHCGRLGLSPDLLIGDFDSLPHSPAGVEEITLSPDKNYTDSWHAAEFALSRGFRRFLLAGMLGGRLDHTLANLGLLAHLVEQGAEAFLTDGVVEAHALVGKGALHLTRRTGCYFSLLALAPCREVNIHGGKYPLTNYPLSATDQRAVSNEFSCSDVKITQAAGVLVVVSQPKA